MLEIDFLTFATSNWKESKKRISSQIESIQKDHNFFRKTALLNENDLNSKYIEIFGKYLSDKGYAYYSWKPWIIMEALKNINNNSYLFYIDGGCSFPNGQQRDDFLSAIVNKCSEMEKEFIDFGCATTPKHIPVDRTIRMEILKHFNLDNDNFFRKKYPHFQAGMMLIKKTNLSEMIVKQWLDFFIKHYDTMVHVGYEDKFGQDEHFIHFTGDQAILQCLLYLNHIKVLDCFDPFFTYSVYSRIRK